MVAETLVVLAVAFALRRLPALVAPLGAGVDQWFWEAYIGQVRGGEFPPRLPQFLLDEAQWYPPLFPLLLARLPAVVFARYARQAAVLIDLLRLVLLIGATRWLTGSDHAALVAGAAYAITPLLVSYNTQLNPRGLGALFLDALWLCIAAADAPVWFWLPALVFAGLVLLTHKMTTQLLWFTAFAGAGLALDARLALLVPGSMLAALVLSGGFYIKVFRGHMDVVRFWYRNWRWIGSNPVLESPVYGEPGFESPSKYYRRGLKAWIRRLQFVIGFNPWMPAVLGLMLLQPFFGHDFSRLEAWVLGWLSLTFAFALLTTVIPALRCFGQGYLYGYNGSFPAAMALGMTWVSLGDTWIWKAVVGATVVACILALLAFLRALRGSRTAKVDVDLDAAIRRLADLPRGAVICLPQHWHDVVAYRARQPVVFGGHGYGFRHLQPLFPRLLQPIKEVIARYDARYLLTHRGYCNAKFLSDLPPATIEEFGEYQVYRFLR
jgi:hypothetical protein